MDVHPLHLNPLLMNIKVSHNSHKQVVVQWLMGQSRFKFTVSYHKKDLFHQTLNKDKLSMSVSAPQAAL